MPAPGWRPPHVTINSGSGGDLLSAGSSDGSAPTPGSSRHLIPPRPPLSSARNNSSQGIYGAPGVTESSEMLLTPSRTRAPRRYQDSPTPDSRSNSAMSSRRTSYSSDGGQHGPFATPFDDSRGPSRAGSSSDDEAVNTQTVSDKYNIMPSAGLLLYPEDVEKDDWLHNPDPNDKDPRCDVWNRRGIVNMGGLLLVTMGILVLMVVWPVLTSIRQATGASTSTCSTDPLCLSDTMPLLTNQRRGLIDSDTPESAKTKTAKDGTQMKLVFSDEFNKPGRTFFEGDDPYFEAVDIWYGATEDLEWYDPDAVTTGNGTLNIRFDAYQSHNLNYRSGMLQSWNKMCFKGGRMEASISLPARGDVEGLWPGFWAMGNLGRPGYLSTTDGLWPYSYWDKCDAGITPNQSATDGISSLPGMRLPACTCSGQDHPNAGKSRSAPEIDALEASVGFIGPGYAGGVGSASQSFQAAPFDVWYQPDYNFVEVYDNAVTSINAYTGGVYQEALSGVTWLNNNWYDGKGYQLYGFEYTPGVSGDITWLVGDTYTWRIDHRAIRPNGNIGQRTIPEEPMSIILNLGMSNTFAQVFLHDLSKLFPAVMRVDYVRIYQNPNDEQVTCDPPNYPTTDYIKNHPEPYSNPNLTHWSQTAYTWPENTLMNRCS